MTRDARSRAKFSFGGCRCLIVALSIVIGFSTKSGVAGVLEATNYLVASQHSDGSWGGSSLARRDTAVVLEALRRQGVVGSPFQRGATYLSGSLSPNVDELARRSNNMSLVGTESLLADLWVLRRAATTTSTELNYPEGGWGLLANYQSDTLDTSLALLAFGAGGYGNGLTARSQAIGVNSELIYTVPTRQDATSLTIRFPALSFPGGSPSLRVWLVGPAGRLPPASDYLFTQTNQATTWDGADTPPFAPGAIAIHVKNNSTVAGVIDVESSFVAGGIDSRSVGEPVNYLRRARNAGAGWGAIVGAASDLDISIQALLALQAMDRAFETTTDSAPGITWLKSQKNGDGGFGTGPGSTTFETALAYIALATDNPLSAEALSAKSWLESHQLANGSWSNDAYQTALAVIALPWATPDADGDLVHDPYDNCTTTTNPDQLDTDHDALGNVCDLDDDNDGILDDGNNSGSPNDNRCTGGVTTGCDDNCISVRNARQYDRDGDREGDACDPDDGEVGSLTFLADKKSLSWTAELGARDYNVYRGALVPTGPFAAGCLQSGVNRDADADDRPDATDGTVPSPGAAFGYLVTAEVAFGEGSLGRASSGSERVNATACPCTLSCSVCGNSICRPSAGENCLSCPQDCNGVQSGTPANQYCCGNGAGQNPVSCSDPRCSQNGRTCSP